MQRKEIQRGDLFYYDFGKREGSVQSGERPVMVIQADNFNANAPTIIVAAVTAVMKKKYLPSHIILGEDFGLKKPSMVLLEQIQTVNKDELTDYIGSVNDERLWKQITLNDMYELWKDLKRGLKNNTFENYKYMYETFVRNQIGSKMVSSLKKTDIKRFYNYLADERHLKPATIDNIHTVLHQILDMAVDDDYLRNNPSNNVLKELKQSHCFQTEKRRALTRPEQELFLSYLKNTPSASLWYPIFAVLVGTGLRVGEATGLRWCDIDLDEGIINVNHTLVYYDHRTDGSKRGCYFNINTTKTPAGKRQVPMLDFVKEAFLMEKERQSFLIFIVKLL